MLVFRHVPDTIRNQLARSPATKMAGIPDIKKTLGIIQDLQDEGLQDLLSMPAVRQIPVFRTLNDAFAVLVNRNSTAEQRAAAMTKLSTAYESSPVASLLEGLRDIVSSGLSKIFGLYWSKINPRTESVRKELASDPLALKIFNATQAFMAGGAATAREILNLAKVVTAAPAADLLKAIQNVNFWATLVMRQELVAPYESMSHEQLDDEVARGRIPASVLQAAKDLTAQGMWAAGLYEVNVARKLAQIRKYERTVAQFLAKKKWVSYADVSRNSWSDIPAEVQAVVKRLIALRRGVDVSWGGGATKCNFNISDGAGALGDLYLALTVDGSAYLADLKDKANQLVLALRLLTSLMSKPPSAGADSGSFAKEAVAYVDTLKKQLAVVFGDGSSEGLLEEFTDSLATASEYGISKNGLDNQLKIAFPDDIDGDGNVENTTAGFFKEISGLIAGKDGLLDVAIKAIEKTQENYGASLDKEAKAKMAAIMDLVFGIASAGAGISAGALKVSTSVQDLVKEGPNFRKALGDLFSTIGGTLGLVPTLRSAIDTFGASKTKIDLLKDVGVLSSSVTAISDKLDQLRTAFFNLYRRLGPDLPKRQIGDFSNDISLEDPGSAGPDREGYIITWWEKKQSDNGPYWLLYGLPVD